MNTWLINFEPLPARAGFVAGCCLREGPHDGTLIEIEPRMKTLRHKGDDYHRIDTATRTVNGTRYRIYLWEHWSPQNTDYPHQKCE
jgi:hypothetical protein